MEFAILTDTRGSSPSRSASKASVSLEEERLVFFKEEGFVSFKHWVQPETTACVRRSLCLTQFVLIWPVQVKRAFHLLVGSAFRDSKRRGQWGART